MSTAEVTHEVIIPQYLKRVFDSEIKQIRILEETQEIIYLRLLGELGLDDNSKEAEIIFDYAFNRTPHVMDWIKFQ